MRSHAQRLAPIVATVAASATALVVQLCLPFLLSQMDFARFCLAWATAQFGVVGVFEWLRVSMLRVDPAGALNEVRYLTSLYCIAAVCFLLCAVWLVSTNASELLSTGFATAMVAYVVCQGFFDASQAHSRATGSNYRYAIALLVRSALTAAMVLLTAVWTRKGSSALVAFAMSFAIVSIGLGATSRGSWARPALPTPSYIRYVLTLGFGMAGASAVTTAMFVAAKWRAVPDMGVADAAGFILAMDLSQKFVSVPLSALSVVLFQSLMRRSRADPLHRTSFIASQAAIVGVLAVPLVAIFIAAQSLMIPTLIHVDYRPVYSESIVAAALCAGLFGFKIFALDTAHLATGDGAFAAGSSLVGFITSVIAYFLMRDHFVGGQAIIVALLVGLVANILVGLKRLRLLARERLAAAIPVTFLGIGLIALTCLCQLLAPMARMPMVGVGTCLYFFALFKANFGDARASINALTSGAPSI